MDATKKKTAAASKEKLKKATKTTPAAAATAAKAKASKALTTTKKTPETPRKKQSLNAPEMVFTTDAVRRILLSEFKRQKKEVHLSPAYVEAVRRHLTAKVHRHVRNATALSLYRGMQSTDARACDLLTLMEYGYDEAIKSIIYAKHYNVNSITDTIRQQPLLLEAAPKTDDK